MRLWEMDELKDFEVARKIEETQVLRMTDPSAYVSRNSRAATTGGCGACEYFSVWSMVFSGVSEAHCESELHSLPSRAVETSARFV